MEFFPFMKLSLSHTQFLTVSALCLQGVATMLLSHFTSVLLHRREIVTVNSAPYLFSNEITVFSNRASFPLKIKK